MKTLKRTFHSYLFVVEVVFDVLFLVTGACENTQANFSLLSTCSRSSVRLLFCHLRKLLLLIWPLTYVLDLTWVVCFHLAPHSPRLVVMVAKFFCV